MFVATALGVGILYAAAFYLLLGRSSLRLVFGLLLLGHAAHLLIFAAGGLVRATPAIVTPGSHSPLPGCADPIPQALILTAIVISFAVLAFAAALVRRAYDETSTDDTEAMRESEP